MPGGLTGEDDRSSSSRRPRRRLLIGIASTVAAIGLGFGVAWQLTSGLANTANGFLSAVAADNIPAAKRFLSAEYQDVPGDYLRKVFTDARLTQYASASWNKRSVVNSQGKLSGALRTRSGEEFDLGFDFVKENGAWKIRAFSVPHSFLSNYPVRNPRGAKQ